MVNEVRTEDKLSLLNLSDLLSWGWLLGGELHFARFCARDDENLEGKSRAVFEILVASVCRFLREGHSCVPLQILAEYEVHNDEGVKVGSLPSLSDFRECVKRAQGITRVSQKEKGGTSPSLKLTTPLVIDAKERVYISRLFDHEQDLTRRLAHLVRAPLAVSDETWQVERLEHYFPSPSPQASQGLDGGDNRQRQAAQVALNRRLGVIVGGPGTGKTSTVVKVLALLAEQAKFQGRGAPAVLLLAPTGKAAARMTESIVASIPLLKGKDSPLSSVVTRAITIHRALGVIPGNPSRFRCGPGRQLRADIVIVDEASMVDLALMRHLLAALKDEARLILLGDRYQLASVEAGSVLAELCSKLSLDTHGVNVLQGGVVELSKSYRFAAGSGIFELSARVRQGLGTEACDVLCADYDDLTWLRENEGGGRGPGASTALRSLVVKAYGAAFQEQEPQQALERMNEFRVLCAHRKGIYGVELINELIRSWLASAGFIPTLGEFYRGRPLLITQNDYELGLHNGDVGVIWPESDGKLVAYFPTSDGEGRRIPCGQLPRSESAFALTIHKSQGSEYAEVVVILPQADSPLLTRELMYTGITRAKKHVTILASRVAIVAAAQRKVARYSGVADALLSQLSQSI